MPTHKIGIYIFAGLVKQNDHKIVVVPNVADSTKPNALKFEVRLLDAAVAEVELEMKTLPLLDGGGGQGTKCVRKAPKKQGSRKIDFSGHARKPDNPDVVFDTYTVRAFDDNNVCIAELDPIIIICDP